MCHTKSYQDYVHTKSSFLSREMHLFKLRIRLKKVKDLLNNISILTIFFPIICKVRQNFPIIMQFSPIFCSLSFFNCIFTSCIANFMCFWKMSHFWAKFFRKFLNFKNKSENVVSKKRIFPKIYTHAYVLSFYPKTPNS